MSIRGVSIDIYIYKYINVTGSGSKQCMYITRQIPRELVAIFTVRVCLGLCFILQGRLRWNTASSFKFFRSCLQHIYTVRRAFTTQWEYDQRLNKDNEDSDEQQLMFKDF